MTLAASRVHTLSRRFAAAVGLQALAMSRLSNPRTAIWAVIFIIVWQGFGWALLFYYVRGYLSDRPCKFLRAYGLDQVQVEPGRDGSLLV